MNPAENYCNPCSKDWKYMHFQAQIDATRAARNQRKKAAKQKEKDDGKAKKQKEKDDAKVEKQKKKEAKGKGKGKGPSTAKAKPAKNTATDSTKRRTKRPRDGDDQDGSAPKRMGGQVDGASEPMRMGRPLGRIPVCPKRDASPHSSPNLHRFFRALSSSQMMLQMTPRKLGALKVLSAKQNLIIGQSRTTMRY